MRNLAGYEGTTFRHFEGNLYELLYIAEHTETNEQYVVYKALYGIRKIHIKPYDMFNETIPEGKENPMNQLHRYESVG